MSEWFPTFSRVGQAVSSKESWQQLWQTPLRDILRLHLSGRLNWQAKLFESDLPERAQQKITQVVKSTRLWRLEKSQIADELIAHFQDGQQSGASIDSMLANFGETKSVARLMRSAKKRNRSIFWKAFVASGYLLAAFTIFYTGLAVWFFAGKPNPSVDYYAVVSANARAVPEDQKAWPIYREAWIEHDFIHLNIPKLSGQEADESWNLWRPGDEKWPRVVAFLEEHESLVAAIREGGQKSGFGHELKSNAGYSGKDKIAMFGRDNDPNSDIDPSKLTEAEEQFEQTLIAAQLPHIQQMRTMSRILQADVFRMAETENAPMVVEDFRAMLGLGRQAAETPFLVCGLVGLALDGIAYRTIEEFLTDYPDLLNDRQLARIAQAVESSSPRNLVRYDGERATQKDLVQRIFSDDGSGDGRLTDEGLTMLPTIHGLTGSRPDAGVRSMLQLMGPGLAFMTGSRKRLEQSIDGMLDEYTAEVNLPYYQRSRGSEPSFEQLIEKYAADDIVARTYLGLLMPAVEQVTQAGDRGEGQRAAVLLALAAHRFRLKHDRFPTTADELVPEFIDSVPFDEITGDPLMYRLTVGAPVIYSVGADRDDDLGTPAVDSNGDRVDGSQHFLRNAAWHYDGDWVLWPQEPPLTQ